MTGAPLAEPVSLPSGARIAVSVVMPCLNEARTLAQCIMDAEKGLADSGVAGEIVIADNGSTDGSQAIAERLGARVVPVGERGYGAALRAGIDASRGDIVVMGDADASYDFTAVPLFAAKIKEGNDLVVGNRFQGGIDAHAMPWSHRYVGNPVLSRIGRVFFKGRIGDFHCGIRAFTRDAYDRLQLNSVGMEFASEMITRALLLEMHVAEIPVRLRQDGRDRAPHLRTWPDGWRHLRFMLLYSPRWLFFIPGGLLLAVGTLLMVWLTPSVRHIGPIGFDVNSLLIAGFLCLVGYQLVVFGLLAKTFVVREGLHPPSPALTRLYRHIRLETGALAGLVMTVAGLAVMGSAAVGWWARGFPELNPTSSIRLLVPAVVVSSIGVETIFASFMLSVLGIPRAHLDRRAQPRVDAAPADAPASGLGGDAAHR